jgi:hypothetical protein
MSLRLVGWNLAVIPFALFGLALFWGAPLLAVVSQLLATITKRPLPGRLALHFSRLAAAIHPAVWAVIGAVAWTWPLSPLSPSIWIPGAMACVGSTLTVAWSLSWSQSRVRPVLHLCLGILANLCLKLSYWTAFVLETHLPMDRFFAWSLAGLWPTCALFLTACCGPTYLILRRKTDDWGRDYYRYGASTLGLWVVGSGLLYAAILGSTLWSAQHLPLDITQPPILIPTGITASLTGIALLLGGILARQEHPMRHKIVMFSILVCGLAQTCVLMIALAEGIHGALPQWSITTPISDWPAHIGQNATGLP